MKKLNFVLMALLISSFSLIGCGKKDNNHRRTSVEARNLKADEKLLADNKGNGHLNFNKANQKVGEARTLILYKLEEEISKNMERLSNSEKIALRGNIDQIKTILNKIELIKLASINDEFISYLEFGAKGESKEDNNSFSFIYDLATQNEIKLGFNLDMKYVEAEKHILGEDLKEKIIDTINEIRTSKEVKITYKLEEKNKMLSSLNLVVSDKENKLSILFEIKLKLDQKARNIYGFSTNFALTIRDKDLYEQTKDFSRDLYDFFVKDLSLNDLDI